MAKSILKDTIHATVARSFYNGILNRTTSAYYFLGKTLPWDDVNDDPPDATQSYQDEYEVRNNLISSRRVLDTEYSFALPRVDWEANTVYDMYDPTYSDTNIAPSGAQSIVDASIYVLTDDWNIYKCIDNAGGSQSTIKPSGTSLSYITLADGYTWKYMMPMSILSRGRFLSEQHMPVQNSVTDSFYSPGLTPILINGGTGYIEDNTLISVVGDGAGAVFQPVIDVVTGEITNINVVDPGEGYTAAEVFVSTPNPNKAQGTGAIIEVDLNVGDLESSQSDVQLSAIDGEISTIVIENGGSGYTSAAITITGDGTGATATAIIENGSITSIVMTNRGSGYTYSSATVSGDGADATVRIIIAPIGGHGHNIVEESFADIVAFYMDTTEDVNQGFDLYSDYRQAGILINPDQFTTGGTRRLYTGDRGSACWVIEYDSLGVTLNPDDTIVRDSDNIEFYIVQMDEDNNNILVQNLLAKTLEVGDTFSTTDDISLFTVTAVIEPEIDKFSGTLLYFDNKEAYREETDQNVILKTYIEF